jgi:hypothetical protein
MVSFDFFVYTSVYKLNTESIHLPTKLSTLLANFSHFFG